MARKKKVKPWTYVKRKKKALAVGLGLTVVKGALSALGGVAAKAAAKGAGMALNPKMKTYPRPLPARVRKMRAKRVATAMASNPKKKVKAKKKSYATPPWLMRARTVVHDKMSREGLQPKKYEVTHLQPTGKVAVKPFSERGSAERYLSAHPGGSLTLLVKDRQDRLRSVPYPSRHTGTAARTFFMGKLLANKPKFKRTRIASPKEYAKKSFRTITPGSGRHKMVVGCPKGKFKHGRCKTGMEVQSVLTRVAKLNPPHFALGWSFDTKREALKARKTLQADFGARFFYRVQAVTIKGQKQFGLYLKTNVNFFKQTTSNPGRRRNPRRPAYRFVGPHTVGKKCCVCGRAIGGEGGGSMSSRSGERVFWCDQCDRSRGPTVERRLGRNPGIDSVAGAHMARVGGVKYRTVDTRTKRGIEEAERLKAQGWQIGSIGFSTIQFYRPKTNPGGYTLEWSQGPAGTVVSKRISSDEELLKRLTELREVGLSYTLWDSTGKVLESRRAVAKNPGPVYHKREAKRYAKLLGGDLKAKHKEAAEYWQGALSAEAAAVAAGRVVKNPRKSLTKKQRARIEARLKYLRGEIKAERISYGEIAELQSLARFIDPGDTLLLEWAGVPESKAKRNPLLMVVPNEQSKAWYIKFPGSVYALGPVRFTKSVGEREARRFAAKWAGVKTLPRGFQCWPTNDPPPRVNPSLSVPEQHQLKIALKTLCMSPVMARVMGGMTHDEAKRFLKKVGYTDAQIAKMAKNPGVAYHRYHMKKAETLHDKLAESFRHGEFKHVSEGERLEQWDRLQRASGRSRAHADSAAASRKRHLKNPMPAALSVVMNRGDDMQSLMKDPRFAKAVALYRKFHGCDPKSISRRLIPVGGKSMVGREFFVSLGKAPSEAYTPHRRSKKAGNIYVHPYDRKPEKVVSADGKTIITLPGSHKVTDWIRG